MNCIVATDLHIKEGKLDLGRLLLQDLRGLCVTWKASYLLLGGDVTNDKPGMPDTDRGVSSHLLQMLTEELYAFRAAGISVVWVRGNHEITEKSNPEDSFIKVFTPLCEIVNSPSIIRGDGWTLALMPWYMGQHFLEKFAQLKAAVKGLPGAKVLVAHVGVDEGQVSSSNTFRTPQQVKLKDLEPELWDYVFLGDYHPKQFLGKNVMYCGCAVPLAHGDAQNNVQLLEISSTGVSRRDLELTSKYPQYCTYTLKPNSTLALLGFDRGNHNLIHCPESLLSQVSNLYRGINTQIRTYAAEPVKITHRRMSTVNEADALAVYAEWLTVTGRGKDSELAALGRAYLFEAQGGQADYGRRSSSP